jgi:hypothetical protein
MVIEVLLASEYEVSFDAEAQEDAPLKSRIYFYRLTAGSYSQTKKFILLK